MKQTSSALPITNMNTNFDKKDPTINNNRIYISHKIRAISRQSN